MDLRILPSGYRDLAAARDFYDCQSIGLGDYFLESIFSEIESLRIQAGIHRKLYGFHRLLVTRFPYAIYYKIDEDEAVVYRFLDCRRDPKKLRKELK